LNSTPASRTTSSNSPTTDRNLQLIEIFVRAFSSEVGTGSREENASKQKSRASVLIQSEPIMLQAAIFQGRDGSCEFFRLSPLDKLRATTHAALMLVETPRNACRKEHFQEIAFRKFPGSGRKRLDRAGLGLSPVGWICLVHTSPVTRSTDVARSERRVAARHVAPWKRILALPRLRHQRRCHPAKSTCKSAWPLQFQPRRRTSTTTADLHLGARQYSFRPNRSATRRDPTSETASTLPAVRVVRTSAGTNFLSPATTIYC